MMKRELDLLHTPDKSQLNTVGLLVTKLRQWPIDLCHISIASPQLGVSTAPHTVYGHMQHLRLTDSYGLPVSVSVSASV